MSSTHQEYLYRQLFRLKIHESMGDAFQALFSKVMQYTTPGFQAVSPWGNWGDGGNDGWIETEAHYFQVYGPKPSNQIKELEAVNKSVGDFDKLVVKWGKVSKYTFVMNDYFKGIPAPVGNSLKNLADEKCLDYAGAMGGMELLKEFMSLSECDKQDIVGLIPEVDLDFIDSRAVGEVLNYLAYKSSSDLAFLSETAPDFDEKIKINGISKPIKLRLEMNSYQLYLINEFLNSVDNGLEQRIAQEVKETYAQSKFAISSDIPDRADLRYLWMIDRLLPSGIHENAKASYRFAAELILAKYFETCDAYEHPNNASTT
ncbi:ABC-three component system protein [Atlantibacter subterranea]|uniref:ABC-three component system protein n=1 Tax=Atlantibacter subterraneus TaxID=255519 RepID=A0ABU4DYZ4_9ENTR|nr:ABC-three component system protein [Atlantibacter subterranea]MDV7022068.1 ABC-three component system protein [Atlantibacter subterranea]MDZ5665587.1 ABC-three component system protein [Atlantibacter hermannii]